MRVFVAVDLPAPIRDAMVAAVAPVRGAWPALGWVAPERWHLTLTFCGDVDAAQVDALVPRLERAAARTEPFDVTLDGAGRFGHRVLFATVDGDRADLRRLAERTAAAARRVGVEVPQERYHPHMTLARARRPTDLRPVVEALGPVQASWTVDHIVLVRSTLGAHPKHDVLAQIRLA